MNNRSERLETMTMIKILFLSTINTNSINYIKRKRPVIILQPTISWFCMFNSIGSLMYFTVLSSAAIKRRTFYLDFYFYFYYYLFSLQKVTFCPRPSFDLGRIHQKRTDNAVNVLNVNFLRLNCADRFDLI